jgi:spermidine synthase
MPALKAASVSNKRATPRPGATKTASSRANATKRDHFSSRSVLLFLLLFFSGTAALVYQVLWIRQLTLVVGVEVYSITIAVSAFFSGLAVGGAFLGRIADRWNQPLLGYALLKFGVVVTGISATLVLGHAAGPFEIMQDHIGFFAWAMPFLLVGALAAVLGSAATRKMRWLVLGMGTLAVVVGVLTPPDRLERLLLTTRGGGALLFYEESRGGTVAVAEHISADNAFRRLYIQGVSNSGDAMPSLRYMRLQALLPLLIHRGDPRSALVIGFGTGITTGALLRYPQLEKRVCAELFPAVVRAGDLFPENYHAAHDSKVQIRMRDGRQELLRSEEKYDLITLEPPPPSAEGVVNLYSRDFYQLAKKRLVQDGILAQWLPISTQNDEDTRSLVRSFLDVFPYATLWTTELHEMLLIGSGAPIELDAREIATRFADPKITATLSAVGIASPAALLATYVTDRQGLERYVSNALPVTDNDPRIEYSTWVRDLEITRVLPKLLSLQSDPPLTNTDANMRSAISAQRHNLFDFYAAGIAAYNGDRESWGRTINRVVSQDSDNPYYRWIIGGRQ